jgi:AcrR family transcriptional regulator
LRIRAAAAKRTSRFLSVLRCHVVTGRPLRADAARNRVALLGAARGAFAEHGSAIGAAELVRHAGVSKAALFRHFKTKRELLLAVLTGDLRDLLDRLARAAELADAAEAFRAFDQRETEKAVFIPGDEAA